MIPITVITEYQIVNYATVIFYNHNHIKVSVAEHMLWLPSMFTEESTAVTFKILNLMLIHSHRMVATAPAVYITSTLTLYAPGMLNSKATFVSC